MSNEDQLQENPEEQSYEPPQVEDLGTLEEITGSNSGIAIGENLLKT